MFEGDKEEANTGKLEWVPFRVMGSTSESGEGDTSDQSEGTCNQVVLTRHERRPGMAGTGGRG